MSLFFQGKYGYDSTLGRKGNGMLGGEEVALITAMLRDGLQGVWVPQAKVRYFIPWSRQKTHYLRRYFHGQGFFSARSVKPSEAVRLFGYPRWLIRAAVLERVRLAKDLNKDNHISGMATFLF